MKYYTISACLFVGQLVCVDTLLRICSYPLSFPVGEFCDEVSDNLPLYGHMWAILYVELT